MKISNILWEEIRQKKRNLINKKHADELKAETHTYTAKNAAVLKPLARILKKRKELDDQIRKLTTDFYKSIDPLEEKRKGLTVQVEIMAGKVGEERIIRDGFRISTVDNVPTFVSIHHPRDSWTEANEAVMELRLKIELSDNEEAQKLVKEFLSA